MGFATYVQLIRNSLCVAKSLGTPKLPFMAAALPNAPFPFNQVKYIEWLIASTQLAAVLLFANSAFKDFSSGAKKVLRSKQFLAALDQLSIHGGTLGSTEYTLMRNRLQKDLESSTSQRFSGILELLIGVVFVYLMNNSLHLHGPTHPKPLINALIVMNFCVVFFLAKMWKEIFRLFSNSRKASKLVANIDDRLKKNESNLNFATLYNEVRILQMATEVGFLDNIMEIYNVIDKDFNPVYEESPFIAESVREDLGYLNTFLTISANSLRVEASIPKITDEPKGPRPPTIPEALVAINKERIEKIKSIRANISLYQKKSFVQGIVQSIYFLLNFIALYGYALIVFAYYFPKASWSDEASPINYFAKTFMLGMKNDAADFYGGLVGDLAWTIEPIFALFIAPKILASAKPDEATSESKEKKE